MKETLKKEEVGFTQVKNDILYNKSLSLKAKGLYAYLYSKPDGWSFSAKNIAKESKDGEDGILTCLRELQDSGYITRVKLQNGHVNINVYTQNGKIPDREIARQGKSLTGKSPSISNTVFSSNTISNSNKDKADKSALFDFKSKLSEMLSSTDKRMPVIAKYWFYKGLEYDTDDKYRVALKRELRPASDLVAWPLERIEKVMFWLNGTKIEGWTMETVIKYIDKNLDELSKNNFYN